MSLHVDLRPALPGGEHPLALQLGQEGLDGGHQDALIVVGVGVPAHILVLDGGAQIVGEEIHSLHDLDLAPVRLPRGGDGGQGVDAPGDLGLDAVVDQD